MASMRAGLSVLALVMVMFALGCESQKAGTKHDTPSQAGSPAQQCTMEHDKGPDKKIK